MLNLQRLVAASISLLCFLLPAAAENSVHNIYNEWIGHDVAFALPSNFYATEENESEIVFTNEQNSFVVSIAEIDHEFYASASTSQIESMLCERLINANIKLENSYAQTRQTNDFRIRSIMAPNNDHSNVSCCACLIGEKHTFLVIIQTTQQQYSVASVILDSFEER